jgi:hypothetical protein
MKKTLLLSSMALIIALSITSLQSCKKGAEDPAISLRSRASRLAGTWTLTKFKSTTTNSNGTSTDNIEGTTGTTVSSSGNTNTYTVNEYTYAFDKNGTYKMNASITYNFGGQQTTSISTSNGTWNFLSKGGDLNEKESIYLSELSSTNGGNTTTYSSNSNGVTWVLTSLKNKSIILDSKDGHTQPNVSSTTTHMELEAK